MFLQKQQALMYLITYDILFGQVTRFSVVLKLYRYMILANSKLVKHIFIEHDEIAQVVWAYHLLSQVLCSIRSFRDLLEQILIRKAFNPSYSNKNIFL